MNNRGERSNEEKKNQAKKKSTEKYSFHIYDNRKTSRIRKNVMNCIHFIDFFFVIEI